MSYLRRTSTGLNDISWNDDIIISSSLSDSSTIVPSMQLINSIYNELTQRIDSLSAKHNFFISIDETDTIANVFDKCYNNCVSSMTIMLPCRINWMSSSFPSYSAGMILYAIKYREGSDYTYGISVFLADDDNPNIGIAYLYNVPGDTSITEMDYKRLV